MTAQFRIGGVYRQKDGSVVRLLDRTRDFPVEAGLGHARHVDGAEMRSGFRRLSDGVDTINFNGGKRDLLPGELHNVNGQWVPVAEEAPKTPGQFYDEGWNAAHDGLPFDSKATRAWRDGWNDYQDADPAHKIRLDGELAAAVRECITPEPQRPALTWATPKPVDRWEGFTVERFDADDLMPAGPDYDHPLQRMTDPSDPLHGSAWLKVR